jgi:hypothetical protein
MMQLGPQATRTRLCLKSFVSRACNCSHHTNAAQPQLHRVPCGFSCEAAAGMPLRRLCAQLGAAFSDTLLYPCTAGAAMHFVCTALQVFDHDQWASHRSTSRYFRHARGLFTSRIVRGLWSPLMYVGAISLVVCSYEQLLLHGVIHTPSIVLPVTGPFSLSTFGRWPRKDLLHGGAGLFSCGPRIAALVL